VSQIKTKYVGDNQITNAKLSQVSTSTIKGRTTAGSGNVEDLTGTQATSILDVVVGDSGSGGLKGLVPAPSAGDAAAGKFLKADGTFAVPTASPATNSPSWTKYTISHTALQTASVTNTIDLATLPLKTVLHQIMIKQSTAFAGSSITAYTLSVGITGSLQKYSASYDVFQSISDTARSITQIEDVPSFSSSTTLKLTATSTGANLNSSTTGSVDIWLLTSLLP